MGGERTLLIGIWLFLIIRIWKCNQKAARNFIITRASFSRDYIHKEKKKKAEEKGDGIF